MSLVLTSCPMGHSDGLHRRPQAIADLMRDNNIGGRSQLSARVAPQISRTTIYRTFTEDWVGEASLNVLNALARAFSVPLAQLVVFEES